MITGDKEFNSLEDPVLLQRQAIRIFHEASRTRMDRESQIKEECKKGEEASRSKAERLRQTATRYLASVRGTAEGGSEQATKCLALAVESWQAVHELVGSEALAKPSSISTSTPPSDASNALVSASVEAQQGKEMVDVALKELAEFNARRSRSLRRITLVAGILMIPISWIYWNTVTNRQVLSAVLQSPTFWRGPSSRLLSIFPGSSLNGKAEYVFFGFVENLAMTLTPDRRVLFAGIGCTPAPCPNSFALDKLDGRLSRDGKTIEGKWSDAAGRHGEWSVGVAEGIVPIVTTPISSRHTLARNQRATANPATDLSPAPQMVVPAAPTRWEGWADTGRSASLSLFPTSTSTATAIVKTSEMVGYSETLAVSFTQDRRIQLGGTGCQPAPCPNSFSLDAFYGEISADGQFITGTFTDAARHAGKWSVARIKGVTPSRE